MVSILFLVIAAMFLCAWTIVIQFPDFPLAMLVIPLTLAAPACLIAAFVISLLNAEIVELWNEQTPQKGWQLAAKPPQNVTRAPTTSP